MRGLPLKTKELLQKARESALLAVEVYNKPTATFRSGAYIVLITIAWTALFQAIFVRRHIPYYEKYRNGRYIVIDGDKKSWDVSRSVSTYFKTSSDPMRKNLEFIIVLRNKLEHRSFPELDEEILGECQAALMNFEETFNKEFPKEPQLHQNLVFAIQFSRELQTQQQRALIKKISTDLTSIRRYIEKFRGTITQEQWDSQKYAFRVFLVPKLGNNQNTSDAAIEFIKYDPNKPEEMAKLKKVDVLIKEKIVENEKIVEKEKIVPSQGVYLLKPGEVAKLVKETIKKPFNINTHTNAWRYFKIRPRKKGITSTVQETNAEYCIFDKAHNDYVYSQKWVDFLSSELKDETKYQEIRNFKST